MLDNMVIVQSAMSSFNNAALYAPTFAWVAVLALPILMGVWMCRDTILDRLGWHNGLTAQMRTALWVMGLGLVWLILMGGAYNVLRDTATTLPYVVAVMMFGLAIGVGRLTQGISLAGQSWRRRVYMGCGLGVVILAAGLSGFPTWWGALLNIGALIGGCIVGRVTKSWPNPVIMMPWVALGISILLLMQPEYFRFGQLGNLTLVHLGAVMIVGLLAAMVFALGVVPCRGRIYHSAYVKLKWLMRVVVALGIVLFGLTESVPVFLGTTVACGLLAALNIYHADTLPRNLAGYVWGILICALGVVTMMPAVSVLGLLTVARMANSCGPRDLKRVL